MLNECVRYTDGMYELFIEMNMKIVYWQILIRKKFISILYIYYNKIQLNNDSSTSFFFRLRLKRQLQKINKMPSSYI